MRKSVNNTTTPTAKKNQGNSQTADRSSGKKLVQARLPFKILAPGAPSTGEADDDVLLRQKNILEEDARQDVRKRKLSYEVEECEEGSSKDTCLSKENLKLCNKKAKLSSVNSNKIVDDADDDDVILVDVADEKNVSEENKKETQEKCERKLQATSLKSSPRTPQDTGRKSSGAGTPKSAGNMQGNKPSASKVLIKLPLSGGKKKNKRRKSLQTSKTDESTNEDSFLDDQAEVCEDMEHIGTEINPRKRVKVGKAKEEVVKEEEDEKIVETIEIISGDEKKVEENSDIMFNEKSVSKPRSIIKKCVAELGSNGDDEIVDEDSVAATTDSHSSSDVVGMNRSPEVVKIDDCSHKEESDSVLKKTLTPKQIKINEQRRKAREDKERKLQEVREQKQREKEEKELSKKRDREEKEEQKRKEREEKDELKRKEREEKERKRQAEIEAKTEEKRKRYEAKEEELRKKEEDRKRKEQEKEEFEMKKKKAAEGFKKFFVAKEARVNGASADEQSANLEQEERTTTTLAFRPFQVKGDMALAPICRSKLTAAARSQLDDSLDPEKQSAIVDCLYLTQLRRGQIHATKWRKPSKDYREDDDVCIVEDELERAGQTIVEETHGPVERLRAKFLKFNENRRPPYYGTWRKKSSIVTARRPFAQEKKYFDYEVDSDLEWEEEEPGESLDGSEDEKEKESEDDDYEVDNEWFVPHGHLSDEEMQNEDECGMAANNDREAQKAKLQLLQQEFAQEMKKKTEKIKPRLVGCMWADENGNQPTLCPNVIWESLNVRAMLCATSPLIEQPEELVDKPDPGSPSTSGTAAERTAEKVKAIALSTELLKDLVRLVHGNRHAKVFLVKEFIAYVEACVEAVKSGEARAPLKSVVRDKIDEYAEWQVMEAESDAGKKKKKRLCWVVANEVLQRMQLEGLSLHNEWQYALQPKFKSVTETTAETAAAIKVDVNEGNMQESDAPTENKKTKFKKTLFAEKETNQDNYKAEGKTSIISTETSPAPVGAKVKKRVSVLMSGPRGQQLPAPAKSALISQFLTKNTATQPDGSALATTEASKSKLSKEEVIVLD